MTNAPRIARLLGLALGLAALGGTALAQEVPDALDQGKVPSSDPSRFASPRWGAFEMSLSGYHPRIDAEFRGTATPFESTFGSSRGLMFRADLAKSLFTEFGTLDVGLGLGYWERYGHGQLPTGEVAPDSTGLRVIPTRVSITYRFDLLANNYPIPIAPYVRLSFDRYWWWVTNGSGGTASLAGKFGRGATNGYSFSGGVAFLLDFIDRGLAREMDRDTGINHTYFFVDFTKSYISDFGSSGSWDMSDDKVTIAGGLLFVF